MTIDDDKYTLLSYGNFHPLHNEEWNTDSLVASTLKVKQPSLQKCETRVNIGEGKQVLVEDFHMPWRGDKNTNPVTHEITYDSVNRFDEGYCYVSGMASNEFSRINIDNPEDMKIFRFEIEGMKDTVPHTLLFSNKKDEDPGLLWVGLEYAGLIVQIDMEKLIKKYSGEGPLIVTQSDFENKLDVRVKDSGEISSIPYPINTHPHGFCFDKEYKNIWSTGKLTNTVGKVEIETKEVKHYELPILEAVPIYLALDAEGNVWGTCLANNTVFRVTTSQEGQEEGIVTELPVTNYASQSRPLIIKKDPRDRMYMWFTTEAGQSVCRIDIKRMNEILSKDLASDTPVTTCMCSVGCRKSYNPTKFKGVITEYPIPADNNYIFGGLTFSKNGDLWVQSYYNVANGITSKPVPSDTIIQIDKRILDVDEIAGVHVVAYQVPTKGSILHRIIEGPIGEILFTELGANRLGILRVTDEKAQDESFVTEEEEIDVQEPSSYSTKEPTNIENEDDSTNIELLNEGTEEEAYNVEEDANSADSVCERYGDVIVKNVAKTMKRSKKLIVWKFKRGSIRHIVEMVWSLRSGKVEIKTGQVPCVSDTDPESNLIPIIEDHQLRFGKKMVFREWETNDGLKMRIIALRGEGYHLEVNQKRFDDFNSV